LGRELAQTCDSIAIALDTWTSDPQLSILAVVGHWITPSFERRRSAPRFRRASETTFGREYGGGPRDAPRARSGAELLTITGDNAGNNGTMCNTLYAELSKVYDDEDGNFRLRPLMRFHGCASFIRCLAHIINLICKDILTQLGVG
jgi:hypothetical protein